MTILLSKQHLDHPLFCFLCSEGQMEQMEMEHRIELRRWWREETHSALKSSRHRYGHKRRVLIFSTGDK